MRNQRRLALIEKDKRNGSRRRRRMSGGKRRKRRWAINDDIK